MERAKAEKLQIEVDRLQDLVGLQDEQRSRDAERLSTLEAMLEVVPVGVVVADRLGRITTGNSAVKRMLGHEIIKSENVDDYGTWVSYHADGRRVESHEYPLSRVIRDGEARSELDVHYQRGDGSRFWLRIIGTPMSDAAGNLTGAAVALIDIDIERRLADQQQVLISELNHRVKNAFSVVKSIVSQSLRRPEIPASLRKTIDKRLEAYAHAHSKLVGSSIGPASLLDIAQSTLGKIGGGQASISGPDITFPERQALALSMAFYELSTNAVKYGSLSVPDGRVRLMWQIDHSAEASVLKLFWEELNGPPAVEPARTGFGSFITIDAVGMETGGEVQTTYAPKGFSWSLEMELTAPEN